MPDDDNTRDDRRSDDTATLIDRLIGGDPTAPAQIHTRAQTVDDAPLLVAAALVAVHPGDLLARAVRNAGSTRDRQLVALADARLRGEQDLLDALVRDHLADHPDDVLAAWIAANPKEHPMSTTDRHTPIATSTAAFHHGGARNTKARRAGYRPAAAAMTGAALLAIAGFTALGSIFEYPQILQEPTADILTAFRAQQGAVLAWFAALTLGAALMAPIGILLGRATGGRAGRWITVTGVAAATVQAVGLSRWLLFVPGVSDDALDPAHTAAAHERFALLHTWLGTVLGETIGYALTAVFTVLISATVVRAIAPRWMVLLGYASAALIATGVLVPLGVHLATLTNFAGYVGWCLWLLALSVALWRSK